MPAMLIETLFVNDDADKYNAERIARMIVKGITGQLVDTVQPQPQQTTPQSSGQWGQVKTNNSDLNVRKGPGLNYAVIGTMNNGEKAKIGTKVGEWVNIYWGDHGGWVHRDYFKDI
ncbi:Bacterial SH3 domain protein [compost metagenome]